MHRKAIATPDDRTPTFELIHREVDSLFVQYFERSLYPVLMDKLFQVVRLASRPAKKCVIWALGGLINASANQSDESILPLLKP
jgi:hypothetical protein